ncbi:hypothetical protein [Bacillus subtilis]|uniref:hypothetical protein n=1 Tax=Bacillus subtilis TaxID=1423 RepID=UPI001BD07F7B|nr:hypothetical protein [Bacillus subtilis]
MYKAFLKAIFRLLLVFLYPIATSDSPPVGTLNMYRKACNIVAYICANYTSGIDRQKTSEEGMRPELGV